MWVILLYGLGWDIQQDMQRNANLDGVKKRFHLSLPASHKAHIYGAAAKEGERKADYNAFACRDADYARYSIWQYFDKETLLQALNWQKNEPIQWEFMEAVQQIAYVDERYLVQSMDTEIYTFYIENQYSFSWKGKLLLIFTPQATLQNGKTYENILFLYEWDSQFF